MRHLASTEPQSDLDAITLFYKTLDLFRLEFDVVIVGFWAQSHLFHEDDFLVLARLAVLFFLLVLESAVVKETAHWRDGRRRHLYQVEAALPCYLERLERGQDAQLLAVVADQTNLADADLLVYPQVSTYRAPPSW